MGEELMEWEHIQPTTSTAQWEDKDEFVVMKDSSIFPPSSHEDLPITTTQDNYNFEEPPPPPPQPPFPSSAPWRWRVCLEIINSGIIQVAYKVRFYAVCAAGFWRLATAAAAGLVLMVFYGRVKRWRRQSRPEDVKDNWMLLIGEKDQKINQLLLQIAQMNEILSASQRVPVLRVG